MSLGCSKWCWLRLDHDREGPVPFTSSTQRWAVIKGWTAYDTLFRENYGARKPAYRRLASFRSEVSKDERWIMKVPSKLHGGTAYAAKLCMSTTVHTPKQTSVRNEFAATGAASKPHIWHPFVSQRGWSSRRLNSTRPPCLRSWQPALRGRNVVPPGRKWTKAAGRRQNFRLTAR